MHKSFCLEERRQHDGWYTCRRFLKYDACLVLSDLFGALPSSLQCSVLLRVADTATDVLNQCRLFLLVVDRYPNQLSDQGVSSFTSDLTHNRS